MNIFISNLSYRVEDSDLKELFGQFGEVVTTKVVYDNQTGRSKCFGFVNMAEKEHVQTAINKLNRTMYDGKIINVSESRTREEKSGKSGYSSSADRKQQQKQNLNNNNSNNNINNNNDDKIF